MPHFEASVIIPVLNQVDAWLKQAVESAACQTGAAEVLVVTSDKTSRSNLDVLERISAAHANVKVCRQDAGAGFAAALNSGIRRAAAQRIGFLMSDDFLDPRAIASSVVFAEDIVSTGRNFVAADGTTPLTELAQEHTEEAWRARRELVDQANFLGHFLLFQREALEKAGGVDENLGDSPGVDDFDLPWRLLEQGASVRIVPQALYNYRDHEGERLTRGQYTAMVTTFNRILDKHGLHGRERQRVFEEHSFWFGSSMWTRYQQLVGNRQHGPVTRKLRDIYRKAVPFRQRIAIHRALHGSGSADRPERAQHE